MTPKIGIFTCFSCPNLNVFFISHHVAHGVKSVHDEPSQKKLLSYNFVKWNCTNFPSKMTSSFFMCNNCICSRLLNVIVVRFRRFYTQWNKNRLNRYHDMKSTAKENVFTFKLAPLCCSSVVKWRCCLTFTLTQMHQRASSDYMMLWSQMTVHIYSQIDWCVFVRLILTNWHHKAPFDGLETKSKKPTAMSWW